MNKKAILSPNSPRLELVPGTSFFAEKPIIDYLDAVHLLVEEFKDYTQEYLLVLSLDCSHYPINFFIAAMGETEEVIFDTPSLFRTPLLSSAAEIIVLHNHPNALAEPSEEDQKYAEKLVWLGKKLNIPIFDQMIFNDKGELYSFKEGKVIHP